VLLKGGDMAVIWIYSKSLSVKFISEFSFGIDSFKYPIHLGLVDSMCMYRMRLCAIVDEVYPYEIAFGSP
jgi:hypothetical protein